MSIIKLRNTIQPYPWGSKTAIPELLGLEVDESPKAELWMGAHPKAPSLAIDKGAERTLIEYIDADPRKTIGKATAERFDGKLPFLFKVLAAAQPLSIQAHPTLEQAREGFARENRSGIAIDAPDRNYRDPNHKPEIVCALTPFPAMCGFRSPSGIVENLTRIAPNTSKMLSDPLSERGTDGLADFIRCLFDLDEQDRRAMLDEAFEAIDQGRQPADSAESRWMRRLDAEYPSDPGVIAPLFLNLVELEPGQALFLGPGRLHAYLEGTAIELMASSDNVLRGGLTRKHIDVSELIRTLSFISETPAIASGALSKDGFVTYQAPVNEFELSRIAFGEIESLFDTQPGATERETAGAASETLSSAPPAGDSPAYPRTERVVVTGRQGVPSIYLCIQGSALFSESSGAGGKAGSDRSVSLSRGESVFVTADTEDLSVTGNAELFRARVPFVDDATAR